MAPSSRDRLSVDLHGLKAALSAHAQAQRVSVSTLIRTAVAREIGLAEPQSDQRAAAAGRTPCADSVRLCIRMTPDAAKQLAAGARKAGLSRGAYLAGLLANVPVLTTGGGRPEHIAALIASSAELSTLIRNIHRLTTLLRQGDVEPARPYRVMLDTLAGDVRSHLTLAARVLADLQPRRHTAAKPASVSN